MLYAGCLPFYGLALLFGGILSPQFSGEDMNLAAARIGSVVRVLALSMALNGGPGAAQSRSGRQSPPETSAGAVAITNVTVIDVLSGAKQPGVTVVTKGGEIAEVGRGLPVPRGAVRIDGAGKFLIPGLWDMHSHNQATGTESLDLYLAHGVVGTRDMGSDLDFIIPLRDRIRRGEVSGPEIVAAGPMLDNAPADWPYRRRVTNAQEAREAVRDLKRRGVDFIKVHNNTPREVFFAIAGEAPKLGLPFAGHIPFAVTIAEGAASGMRTVEHFSESRVFRECAGTTQPYDAGRCRPLFDELATRGIWQTPTLAFFRALPDVFSGKPMPHAEYATDSLLELTRKNIEVSKLDERALSLIRSFSRTSLTVVRDMLPRGNAFLAGCDGSVPGFCLHDELQILTEAGLSPLQAIQAATINPARLLGREKTQGSIAAGKRADLVLLEADPVAEIVNTRRIAAVVVRGRLLSKTDIDRIIASRRRPNR
jgi:Amidohydrolase family